MPLALAQGSNKAERLAALDPACKGRVEGASFPSTTLPDRPCQNGKRASSPTYHQSVRCNQHLGAIQEVYA